MEREELLKKVAPCGLLCYTCTAAKDGAIQVHSQALMQHLVNFDSFANQFSNHEPRLKHYPAFMEVLLMFAEAGCEGCRNGTCMYPGCTISPCIVQKGYDFCFECEDFPCEKVDMERTLKAKWLMANRRMREVGIQNYFYEFKDRSHYT